MSRLDLRLLGTFEASLDGVPLTAFRSDKTRALLAYLTIEAGRTHRRESLADLLWGEYGESAARVSLRKTLSNLRKVLAPLLEDALLEDDAEQPLLTITRQSVTIAEDHPHLRLDVASFAALLAAHRRHPHQDPARCTVCAPRLRRAIELYRGEFLAGLNIEDGPAFSEWRLLQQEHYYRQAVDALETVLTYYEGLEEAELVQRYASRLLELEPWHEGAHRRLMTALARAGRRNEALAQYDRCRRVLQAELGVEPTAETTALYETLLAGKLPGPVQSRPSPATLPPHNLPSQKTAFIGREEELATLRARLFDPVYRLVTVTGEGGVGKTRLSLAAAQRALRHFPDGVWFVPLADEGDEDAPHLPTAIAAALDFTFPARDLPDAELLDYLREKNLLLVVDNLEPHLQGAERGQRTVAFLEAILDAAPGVSLLITSRERLNLHAESVLRLEGLPVPRSADGDADRYASVRLFVERAQRTHAGFTLDDEEEAAVGAVCRLVHGLPLAIELAAAWSEQFSCAEIAETIAADVDFLEAPMRGLPPRHRSMRAVFAHSWRLLAPAERAALSQISIFRGGFSREAALTITGATLNELVALVDKSLLQLQQPGRYQLHSLLRHFVAEKWDEELRSVEQGQGVTGRSAVAGRHSDYYLELVADETAALQGPAPQDARERLRPDMDNVRAAWRRAAARGKLESVRRSAVGLAAYYEAGRLFDEGIALFESAVAELRPRSGEPASDKALSLLLSALARLLHEANRYDAALLAAEEGVQRADEPDLEARARSVAGRILNSMGDNEAARRHLEAALPLARAAALGRVEADVLQILGTINWQEGAYETATACHREALERSRQAEDVRRESRLCTGLANALYYQELYEEARYYYERSLRLTREAGARVAEITSLINLGVYDQEFGRLVTARNALQEAAEQSQRMGMGRLLAVALNNLGLVYGNLGQYEEAWETLHRARERFASIGYRRGEAYAYLHLAIIAHQRGDLTSAERNGRRALALGREIQERHCTGLALTQLGHVAASANRLDEAREMYRQAVALREEIGPAREIMEPQAGLAKLALRQKSFAQARACLEPVLEQLASQHSGGRPVPSVVYLTCYEVLNALQERRAGEVLKGARAQLEEQASHIPDDGVRQRFLGVPANRALLSAIEEADAE